MKRLINQARKTLFEPKKTQTSPLKFPDLLYGKDDLPSIAEFTSSHEALLNKRQDVKSQFTTDPTTIGIVKKILAKGPKSKGQFNFLEQNILTQPTFSSKEIGSIKVKLAELSDFPLYCQQYQLNQNRQVMLCVGGPAAEDQCLIASLITSIKERLDEIIYLTRNYQESNSNHSAKQSHARHANALSSDPSLTGHALLPLILARKLLGVTPQETLEADYKKIDVKLTLDPGRLRIYFANELNWLKQEYKKHRGELTQYDVNRLEALLSQEILILLEKQSPLTLSGGLEKSRKNPTSIQAAFDKESDQGIRQENAEFERLGIKSQALSPTKKALFFGANNPYIYSAYEYPGDSHLKFNIHYSNYELARQKGVNWIEPEEISRVLLTPNEQNKAKVAGVVTKEGKYIYASKIHFSGGYKVDYIFDLDSKGRFQSSMARNCANKIEDYLGLQKPLNNSLTTATGVSINAVFKKSPGLGKLIERYGSTGEIAVGGTNWTMITYNEDYIIMRITAGGNTGSEEYNPSYLLSAVANSRRVFGDDLIGILSSYGCPRAINGHNSTEFAAIAEGLIISYGKGGIGNTKRHSEAVCGLIMLNFDKEVVEYFNQFKSGRGRPLGDNLLEVYKQTDKLGFFHDNIAKINRRMGYDQSLSLEELAAIGLFAAALSYATYKGLIKDKASSKQNTP